VLARILALGSLVAAAAATFGIITASGDVGEGYRAEATERMGEVVSRLDGVSQQISRLTPGRSPRDAQREVREALVVVRETRSWVAETLPGREWPLSDRASVTLGRAEAWLDAVGSILANPSSELRTRLTSRTDRLKVSLGRLEEVPRAADAVRGKDALLRHAAARRG
jgi:hypothetical protein